MFWNVEKKSRNLTSGVRFSESANQRPRFGKEKLFRFENSWAVPKMEFGDLFHDPKFGHLFLGHNLRLSMGMVGSLIYNEIVAGGEGAWSRVGT